MLNSQNYASYINIPTDRLKSREITFPAIQGKSYCMGYRWVTNIHEHKDITIPLIIHYYLWNIQNTTQIFHAKS